MFAFGGYDNSKKETTPTSLSVFGKTFTPFVPASSNIFGQKEEEYVEADQPEEIDTRERGGYAYDTPCVGVAEEEATADVDLAKSTPVETPRDSAVSAAGEDAPASSALSVLSALGKTSRAPPSFRILRLQIFREVHVESMKGGKFTDVELPLYTRRTKTGTPYKPEVLTFSRRILSAASSEFELYVLGAEAEVCADGYTGDSDLEEDGEADLETGNDVISMSSRTSQQRSISTRRTTTSLRFDSSSDPEDEAPTRVSRQRGNHQNKPLQDGAFRTWRAMVLYLYDFNDYIVFNPLQSSKTPLSSDPSSSPETWPCSPKSMYRLAHKFKLFELEDKARDNIKQGLTAENIIQELFNDFTWRSVKLGREGGVNLQLD
ncbi:hypothetical protein EUX98_g1701 [Antrodiella citrinella]|uniref:Uncharacterized protein n=1 Tax=Antrodiella citrinella TaxID=2447956 RepID=A0A4S4N0X1_9APHY|nr:hypothetical protein EUX98_g1701 [Antrodiella citrinella]